MAKDAEWGRWLRSARRAYQERHDVPLTFKEIGERLGARLGRAALKHTTVRAWFVAGQEPESLSVMRALLSVLEADEGYTIVPRAETPEDYDARINPSEKTVESDEVRARNRKVAAAKRAVRKRTAQKGAKKSPAKKAAVKKEGVA